MNGISEVKVNVNNCPKIAFKANERVVSPNEIIFDDLEERKKPVFDFLNAEEKPAPVVPKKEPVLKRMLNRFKNFADAAKQYYNYRNGVKQAVKLNVITKERAKQLLEAQKTILLNILKK